MKLHRLTTIRIGLLEDGAWCADVPAGDRTFIREGASPVLALTAALRAFEAHPANAPTKRKKAVGR